MSVFKQRYPQQIYTYNYDRLVTAPDIEIRALIYWLDWEWSDSYLAPHLNKRAVMTASQAQVRSPISAKSVGGWKRYKQMLKPAYDILVEYQPFAYLIHEYYPA
jgi:hypothetical protein